MRWARHMARMEERRGAYRVGRSEGKSPRSIWEDNIIFNLQEVKWKGMD